LHEHEQPVGHGRRRAARQKKPSKRGCKFLLTSRPASPPARAS
jgi:hypothetical protein